MARPYYKKQYQYQRQRALEHYVYKAKMQRIICTKVPVFVKRQFQNCGRVTPPRMIHIEIFGAMVSSSRAMQPIQAPCSSHSTHNRGNVGFEHGDGASMEEPMKSCQEHSHRDSCTPRSLHKQDITEAYHINKRKELDEKLAAFFYESNMAFNKTRYPIFIAIVNA
jgi:hypothetical protein